MLPFKAFTPGEEEEKKGLPSGKHYRHKGTDLELCSLFNGQSSFLCLLEKKKRNHIYGFICLENFWNNRHVISDYLLEIEIERRGEMERELLLFV